MRPRLVQERILLEKLRAHADELVNPKNGAEPKKETVSAPIIVPPVEAVARESNNNHLAGLITVKEEPEVIVISEPPSPVQLRKESDSFLKEVVEGAKGLNIDLTSPSILTTTSPLLVKKPEVTVARSHTVSADSKNSSKSQLLTVPTDSNVLIDH